MFAFALVPAASSYGSTCSPNELREGTCNTSGTTGPDDVTLVGTGNFPGSGSGGSGSGSGTSGTGDPSGDTGCPLVIAGKCVGYGPGHPGPAAPITLADIANFRPDPGVDHMEPDGWMIVGLDTNFYATGGIHVKNGTLLGLPASVRFTPVAWHWSYGDGTSASRGTPGATWAATGIREFDPTATSHIYQQPGTYYIDLSIDYTAEYTVAGLPWTPIAGTLTLPANRLVATAGYAKTVLVEHECAANPAGPGC